jgi:hypothetical protein
MSYIYEESKQIYHSRFAELVYNHEYKALDLTCTFMIEWLSRSRKLTCKQRKLRIVIQGKGKLNITLIITPSIVWISVWVKNDDSLFHGQLRIKISVLLLIFSHEAESDIMPISQHMRTGSKCWLSLLSLCYGMNASFSSEMF